MNYPTLEEVNAADRIQICRWYRFLDSPGMSAIGCDNFDAVLKEEKIILDRIIERCEELGGFTPKISKMLGWK